MKKRILLLNLFLFCFGSLGFAQENGKLQIHFMSVGQGDGAILISPLGETVLFDNGRRNSCDKPVAYLDQLGITKIDYHIVSHYHDDHIGCTKPVFDAFPLQKQAIDRGGTYIGSNGKPTKTFTTYKTVVGNKRKKAFKGMRITLDAQSDNPVTIEVVALNGNNIATDNENDRSVVAVVRFGRFDAVIGGDLSGFNESHYKDIESSVADDVGRVEVYKVNHHGSRYSTNETWISTIKPRIGIISVGDEVDHNHPTKECLKRLHDAGVRTYWTHSGTGAQPKSGWDFIGQDIVVQYAPSGSEFTVTYNGTDEDTYSVWPGGPEPLVAPAEITAPRYSWSKRSPRYHYSTCIFSHKIRPENLESGNEKPGGKTLHWNCPR